MAKIFRRPRITTLIFYPFLLVLIGAFALVMSSLLPRLTAYLERYEAAHINTQYQQVFHDLFDDPDWGALYDRAGLQDTLYEDKQAYITYMEEKVGDQALSCYIESNGTSGKKCLVYLGNEQIGLFYMDSPPEVPAPQKSWYSDIPFVSSLIGSLKIQSWSLGDLELQLQRQQAITVRTEAERIVLVNGVALTEDHLSSSTATAAEAYLPEGVHGRRTQELRADGFLVSPTVTVTDLQGQPIPMEEVAPGVYQEITQSVETPEDLVQFLTEAGQVYCEYMIKANRSGDRLRKYFDGSSQAYRSIAYNEIWMQGYRSYRFGDASVTEYASYGENIYTARLIMSMYVMRYMGTEKEYPVNTTFFLRKLENGKYQIYDMTNVDIQSTITQVRLRFFQNGELMDSQMVDASAKTLELPQVEAPEGKRFAGWFQTVVDENGKQTLSLVFAPEEGSTTVRIPEDVILQPMDLQARFDTDFQ